MGEIFCGHLDNYKTLAFTYIEMNNHWKSLIKEVMYLPYLNRIICYYVV